MPPATSSRSEATAAARAFVAGHRLAARALGSRLAEEIDDPRAFVAATRAGLGEIADPAYRAGQRLVAPGIGPTLGIRNPLLQAVAAALRRELRGVRPARLLPVADALARDDVRELRWLATRILRWILPDEPELAWQVLRRIGEEADDWITVDTLAEAAAEGVLREPFRWAELDQLVYSRNPWERRLVGSTVASLSRIEHHLGETGVVADHGFELVRLLIGDAEPEVRSALSWALRALAAIDPVGAAAFCHAEAERVVAADDGNRAWVLRDALRSLPAADASTLRQRLEGIRRRPGRTSTSAAAATAAAFLGAAPEAATAAGTTSNATAGSALATARPNQVPA